MAKQKNENEFNQIFEAKFLQDEKVKLEEKLE